MEETKRGIRVPFKVIKLGVTHITRIGIMEGAFWANSNEFPLVGMMSLGLMYKSQGNLLEKGDV